MVLATYILRWWKSANGNLLRDWRKVVSYLKPAEWLATSGQLMETCRVDSELSMCFRKLLFDILYTGLVLSFMFMKKRMILGSEQIHSCLRKLFISYCLAKKSLGIRVYFCREKSNFFRSGKFCFLPSKPIENYFSKVEFG